MSKTSLRQQLLERGLNLSDLARAMNVDKATVTRWAQKAVPAERARDVSAATNIPLHVLRPDLWEAPSETEAA